MAHVRTQLRQAAKQLLIDAGMSAGQLFCGRRRPAAKDEAEVIGIYTDRENSADSDMGGSQERTIQLKFDVISKGEEAAALERLDAIAAAIETAIAGDTTFSGLAQTAEYRSAEFTAASEGERILQVMSLRFDVTIYTDSTDPETGV